MSFKLPRVDAVGHGTLPVSAEVCRQEPASVVEDTQSVREEHAKVLRYTCAGAKAWQKDMHSYTIIHKRSMPLKWVCP